MAATGPRTRQLLPVMAGIICVVSLMLLVGNLRNLDLGGKGEGAQDLVLQLEGSLLPVLSAVWVAALLLVLLSTKRNVAGGVRPQGRGGPGLLIALLLIVSIILVGVALGSTPTNPSPPSPEEQIITPGGDPGNGTADSPAATTIAFPFITLALGAAVVIAGILVLRRGLRPAPVAAVEAPAPVQERTELDLVTEAITDLESYTDARSAILAAYGRMAMRLGHPLEDRTLTPREFAEKTGWRLKDNARSLETLTALFEEARYSDHQMGEQERARALAALRSIEAELGRRTG